MREELGINRKRQQVLIENQEELKYQEIAEHQEELKHQEHSESQEGLKHQEIAEHQEELKHQEHSESQEGLKHQEIAEHQEELKHQEHSESQEELTHQEVAEIQARIEESLQELPIVQYAWISEEEIPFSERVRSICKEECPRYGTSWSCPPGVGSVEQCRQRCGQFLNAFLFTTIAEVTDTDNMEETLATRPAHEAVTKEVQKILETYFGETLALSAQSCAICRACAYPEEPCRCPDQMLPCIEGYGIVVPPLAEKAGIEFVNGAGIVTWFGMVLFSKNSR